MITGSVQISKGYYYLVINLYNEYGKRQPKWNSTGLKVEENERKNNTNKKQAEKILQQALVKLNAENNFSNRLPVATKNAKYENILFCDYMLEWLENKKAKVEDTTYIGYERVIKGKLYSYFKETKIKLIDLRAKDIQDFINYLYKQNLKGTTICHYTANIMSALKEAVIAEIIPTNPMEKVPTVKKEQFIPDFYTDEELMELIKVVKTVRQSLPLILGIVYGLRREEILGITWNVIDFENKAITIKRTVGRGKLNGITQFLIKDIPKNKSSYRTLPLFDFIADLLLEYKEKYKEYKRIFGNTYNTEYEEYICLMENGELMKPDYIDRVFSRLLKENGFRHIRLHDLRHSCATLLLRNGVPLAEIQKWLGHSSIVTTQRYSHLDKNDKTIPEQTIFNRLNSSFKISNEQENIDEEIKKNNYLTAISNCSRIIL